MTSCEKDTLKGTGYIGLVESKVQGCEGERFYIEIAFQKNSSCLVITYREHNNQEKSGREFVPDSKCTDSYYYERVNDTLTVSDSQGNVLFGGEFRDNDTFLDIHIENFSSPSWDEFSDFFQWDSDITLVNAIAYLG